MNVTREIVGKGAAAIEQFLDFRKIWYAQQLPELLPKIEDWRELSKDGADSLLFAVPGKDGLYVRAIFELYERPSIGGVIDRRNLCAQDRDGKIFSLISIAARYSGSRCTYCPSVLVPNGAARGYRESETKGFDSKGLSADDGCLDEVREELHRLARLK